MQNIPPYILRLISPASTERVVLRLESDRLYQISTVTAHLSKLNRFKLFVQIGRVHVDLENGQTFVKRDIFV